MKLSIIIPTYNHLNDYLIPCLNSLTEQCDLTDTEVIVVANGCIDQTEQIVHDSGFQLVSVNRPIGFAKAFEAGVAKARGKYIMSLHNDVTFLPQPKNQVIDSLIGDIEKRTVSLVGIQERYDPNTRRRYIPLFCAVFRKYALDRIGVGNGRNLLDFAGSGEDVAISARITDQHFSIGQLDGNELLESPPAPIQHIGGGTAAKMHNYEYRLARNAAVFRYKLRKPVATSIIVTAFNLEQLSSVIRSVWEHANVSTTEVLIVRNGQDAAMEAYINRLTSCGPYRQLIHPFENVEQAVNLALPMCAGEFVLSLTKPIPWGTWIDAMLLPLIGDDSTVLSGNDLSQLAFVKDSITYLGGFSNDLWGSIRRRGLRVHEKSRP